MEKLPILKKGQVSIFRCDYSTGHVLDEELNLAINEGQKVYTVFENMPSALIYIKNKLNSEEKIQYVLADDQNKLLYTFHSLKDFEEKVSKNN